MLLRCLVTKEVYCCIVSLIIVLGNCYIIYPISHEYTDCNIMVYVCACYVHTYVDRHCTCNTRILAELEKLFR